MASSDLSGFDDTTERMEIAVNPVERLIRKGVHFIVTACMAYAFLAAALMLIHVTADVLLRYVGLPIPGTYEIVSNWYMVALYFLGIAYVERSRGHIVVTLVTDKMPRRWSDVCQVFGTVVMFVLFFIFGWYSWISAMDAYRSGEFREGVIRVLTWPTAFYIPLGCWAGCLQQLLNIYDDSRKLMRRER